ARHVPHLLRTEGARDAEQHARVRAPDHVGPGRAVPEGGERYGDDHVAVLGGRAAAAAAERDVEVVAEPGREADVPAAPVLAGRRREVWRLEVDDQVEAEPLGDAARDTRVAGEVAVH